jgi:translation initiation factor 2 alpha subunit (eIF-2alpha)
MRSAKEFFNELQNNDKLMIETIKNVITEPNDEVPAKIKLVQIYCYLFNVPFGDPDYKEGHELLLKAHNVLNDSDWDNSWFQKF